MAGYNTLWIPGIDHAGIATQAVVEKQLKEKENKTRHDVGREGFVERIWAWKQQYGDRILEQLKRLGCSCDWDRTRFTLDDMCAKAVRETFFKLFKDGLIYRGKRLVNWDMHLQTAHRRRRDLPRDGEDEPVAHQVPDRGRSSADMDVQPVQDAQESRDARSTIHASHGLHPCQRTGHTHMTVATTRPETMLGDTAVAVHSEDPRWNWAIGKFVRLPLTTA